MEYIDQTRRYEIERNIKRAAIFWAMIGTVMIGLAAFGLYHSAMPDFDRGREVHDVTGLVRGSDQAMLSQNQVVYKTQQDWE